MNHDKGWVKPVLWGVNQQTFEFLAKKMEVQGAKKHVWFHLKICLSTGTGQTFPVGPGHVQKETVPVALDFGITGGNWPQRTRCSKQRRCHF